MVDPSTNWGIGVSRRFIAFSCLHFPEHDPSAIDWLLAQIREQQPSYVVSLGDMIDTACLSRFSKDSVASLASEYAAVDQFCSAVNDAAPKAKRVWIQGNHEQRMFRAEHAALSDILDYRKHIRSARSWKHIPYIYSRQHVFRLGPVTFHHGFNCSDSGIKREVINLGNPNGLVISGHTHRPHDVIPVAFGSTVVPYWYSNPGTFIRPEQGYTHTLDTSRWGTGVVVGDTITKRQVGSTPEWTASLITYRNHWDGPKNRSGPEADA